MSEQDLPEIEAPVEGEDPDYVPPEDDEPEVPVDVDDTAAAIPEGEDPEPMQAGDQSVEESAG